MRTIDWADGKIRTIDQSCLPEELAGAISSLRVRGALALGVAGGLGIALTAQPAAKLGEP